MGKVLENKYNCIHILQLEKTLKLYREILGFKLVNAEVATAGPCEGMLVLELHSGSCVLRFSLTAPQAWGEIGEIGNTNHNHFMLKVDTITDIVEQLIAEGYKMEHENYKELPYNFFTGPNGEIVGLCTY